jgi:hypothetical protein
MCSIERTLVNIHQLIGISPKTMTAKAGSRGNALTRQ